MVTMPVGIEQKILFSYLSLLRRRDVQGIRTTSKHFPNKDTPGRPLNPKPENSIVYPIAIFNACLRINCFLKSHTNI